MKRYLLLCCWLGVAAHAAPAPASPTLDGDWDGAIVVTAAEYEVDVSIELARNASGRLQGELWFPTQQPKRFGLQSLVQQGSALSFFVEDTQGVKTSFAGKLSPDGIEIAGTMSENQQRFPFTLRRRSTTAPRQPAMLELAADGAGLRNAFNSQAGHPRLLLVLSPTLFSSRMTLRLVDRYVLKRNADPSLTVFVIWEAAHRTDSESSAREASALADDPRLVYFWSATHFTSDAFKGILSLLGVSGQAVDPCLFFAKEQHWEQLAPVPDHTYQTPQMGASVPVELRFNGLALARDLAVPAARNQ